MIRIEWHAERLETRVRGMVDALSDLRPVWPRVREITIEFFRAIFRSEGAYPWGTAWRPLNPRYAAWKRRHYGDLPILRLTGHLEASLAGGADHVYRAGPAWMEIGTRDIKARTHQWGRGAIPARPIIQRPSRAEGERVVDAILAFVIGRARRSRRARA